MIKYLIPQEDESGPLKSSQLWETLKIGMTFQFGDSLLFNPKSQCSERIIQIEFTVITLL